MSRNGGKLLLVDGSSYLFRAFHKLPPLTGPKGQPTGAIIGAVNMLRKLVREEKPERVGVVFDSKGDNFRHELYPEYKAQRESMPDELAAQIEPLHEVIAAFGFRCISPPNTEADDVIGALAKQGEAAGFEVLIATGDKDLTQLVNKQITWFNSMDKGERLDARGVEKKFGVAPERIPDYLALVGDSVDNIPGVPDVGPKTALDWLTKYGDLEGVKAHADEIKGKRGESLRATLDDLPLMLQLVTLRCDVDAGVSLDELEATAPDVDKLKPLCEEYGFGKWLKEIEEGSAEAASVACKSSVVDSLEALDTLVERLRAAKLFALDVCVDWPDEGEPLAGLAAAIDENEAAYIPIGSMGGGMIGGLDEGEVWRRLGPVLSDESPGKLGCDLKTVAHVLRRRGVALRGLAHDVALASYVYNSVAVRHTIPAIAARHLGLTTPAPEDLTGKGRGRTPFVSLPAERIADYCGARLAAVWRAHEFFDKRLDETSRALYADVELPLSAVLRDMELTGIMIDVPQLQAYGDELAAEIESLEADIHKQAGREFNIASSKQLAEVLFEQLGLPVRGKTPKGQASTNEAVLNELADLHEVPKMILDWRFLSKMKSTYTGPLIALADDEGRVHTTFHQNVTATGRLSSAHPNLQNIPIRTEAGRRIRRCFVAPEGRRLIAADYSQIELRIMAHLSGDPVLCGAFERGDDVHTATASELFGAAMDEVTSDQRRRAKAINFGLIYGMTPFGLAKQIGVKQQEADEYYKTYFDRYKRVYEFIERTRAEAAEKGYVETVFGRRLYVPGITARNINIRQAAERAAINAPMQGTAADLIKKAMIALQRLLADGQDDEDGEIDAAVVLQVHDELVLEAAEESAESASRACVQCMETVHALDVPLVVDVCTGANWEEAH